MPTRSLLVTILLLLSGFATLCARPNYTGYSGAPGRQTCAISCHGNSNGTAVLSGFPDSYTPGTTYPLTLTRTSGSSISNFNGSCRLGSGTTNAGTISAGTDTSTYSTSGETNGIHLSSNNLTSATFNWTAPAAGSGQVRLYLAVYQGSSTNGQTTDLTLQSEEAIVGTPDLVLSSTQITGDDDNDGIAEPGESAELVIGLENQGDGGASGITGTLGGAPSWLTIAQSQRTWPDLAAGANSTAIDPFVLQIGPDAPPLADLVLTLQLDTDQGESTLEIPLAIGTRVPFITLDWETGADGWSRQTPEGWAGEWQLGSVDAFTPIHAWQFGDSLQQAYPAHADGRLVSPSWMLPEGARLSFMHRMNAEVSGTYPDSAYDGGVLELSTDGGQNWLGIQPLGGHDKHFRWLTGSGDPAGHPFPGGTPCYSGTFGWREAVFDLSAWAGQEVQLGWRFGSDDGTQGEGWFVDDVVLSGLEGTVAVAPRQSLPSAIRLVRVYPNPFNPSTTIHFRLARSGPVRLGLHDLRGNRVQEPLAGFFPAGDSEVHLDARGLASGMYLLQVECDGGLAVQKVLFLK